MQTVTPLFLGGADPRAKPELRAPSFRGALRYWLRAALGGALGDDDAGLVGVRRAEAAVFGSTREEWGGASAVAVRIRGDPPPAREYARERALRDPATSRPKPTGRDYLWWSMAESGRPGTERYMLPKGFFPAGMSFSLELVPRPVQPDRAGELGQALQSATAALWSLANLGGIGSRSRRAAGSLCVQSPRAVDGLRFSLEGRTSKELALELGQGLQRVRALFTGLGNRAPGCPSSFDVLHPRTCRVWVLGVWRSSEEAVDAIGGQMRDFRSHREPDHREVARWLSGAAVDTVERAAFGLPLPFRYSGGLFGVVEGSSQEIDRRASPLWLKVSRTAAGGYAGVATLFYSRFLPEGERLAAVGRRTNPPSDYSLVERFISERFQAVEVEYV